MTTYLGVSSARCYAQVGSPSRNTCESGSSTRSCPLRFVEDGDKQPKDCDIERAARAKAIVDGSSGPSCVFEDKVEMDA